MSGEEKKMNHKFTRNKEKRNMELGKEITIDDTISWITYLSLNAGKKLLKMNKEKYDKENYMKTITNEEITPTTFAIIRGLNINNEFATGFQEAMKMPIEEFSKLEEKIEKIKEKQEKVKIILRKTKLIEPFNGEFIITRNKNKDYEIFAGMEEAINIFNKTTWRIAEYEVVSFLKNNIELKPYQLITLPLIIENMKIKYNELRTNLQKNHSDHKKTSLYKTSEIAGFMKGIEQILNEKRLRQEEHFEEETTESDHEKYLIGMHLAQAIISKKIREHYNVNVL